jgi:FAD binding domain
MTAPITGFHLANPSWRNWVGNQSCVPAKIVTAPQEQDVVDAVREARRSGLGLRTPGTGHSCTGVACTDGILLDTRALSGLSAIDAKALTATARPSTTIAEFGAPLWEAGLALQNQGDIDTQTIAGAVATSTRVLGHELAHIKNRDTSKPIAFAHERRFHSRREAARKFLVGASRARLNVIEDLPSSDKPKSSKTHNGPAILRFGRTTPNVHCQASSSSAGHDSGRNGDSRCVSSAATA